MLELGKGDQKVRSSSFEGLDEEQLNTIYRLASHRTLEKGETLFREGEADQTLYVVLEGEIRVVRNLQGQSETISVMHRGAWLGEFGFAGKMPRTETAFASKPSRVLAINKAVVDALDEKTQLPLFKRVCLLGSLRNRNHALRERELAAKNRQLIEALFSTRTKGKLDYTASQMVQSIVNRIPKLPAFASTLAYKLLLEGTDQKSVV